MWVELFSWWTKQIRELIPEQWRHSRPGPRCDLTVVWHESEVSIELLRRRRGLETSLGRFTLDETGLPRAQAALGHRRGLAAILRLPPGLVLERQLTFPLAAEHALEQVVHYEMDRLTPFTADEVHWKCEPRHRDRARDKLTLVIALVPRLRLRPLLQVIARLSLRLTSLESGSAGCDIQHIPLTRGDPRRLRGQRRVFAIGMTCCAALLLANIGLPFLRQRQAREAVEARIEALKPRVAAVDALRRLIAARMAGGNAIANARAQTGEALRTVAVLTELLGDDTHLTSLKLHQQQIMMEGQSTAAAKLIALLSAHAMIGNAAFAAPVMRAENGRDLFSITAEVKP